MASPPPTQSNASRYLFVLLLGLLIGVVGSVMLLRAWQARQDPFPSSLMQVMYKQLDLLQRSHAQNRCAAADVQPRVQSLRMLANDLEPGFPDLRDDRRFQQHASALRATLDAAQAAPPGDCAALAKLNSRIDDDCQACHQDFH